MIFCMRMNQVKDSTFISHIKYAKNLTEKLGLKDVKHACTPMSTTDNLSLDDTSEFVDTKICLCMIGSLLYLCSNMSKVVFSVHAYARFQASPPLNHLGTIERVIKPISGTINYRFWYLRKTSSEISGFMKSIGLVILIPIKYIWWLLLCEK